MKGRARRARISTTDEFCVWSGDGWTIVVSRATQAVRFATTDYHAGPLTLTKRELHELAKVASGRFSGFRRRSK